MATVLTAESLRTFAEAIFKEGPVTVVEAYSAFSQEARRFHCADDLCRYAEALRDTNDNPHLAVHYPDMGGRLGLPRHALDPDQCDGHTFRHIAEGWGLVFVYLQVSLDGRLESFVSANTEKRALAWEATYPDMESPALWNWPAVGRHARGLSRALKRAEAAQGVAATQ